MTKENLSGSHPGGTKNFDDIREGYEADRNLVQNQMNRDLRSLLNDSRHIYQTTTT